MELEARAVPVSSAYAETTAGSPAAILELDHVLAGLLDAISEVQSAAQTLDERADPVLRPASPEVSAAGLAEVHARTPVSCRVADEISERSGRILDAATMLRRSAAHLRDMRDRLEV